MEGGGRVGIQGRKVQQNVGAFSPSPFAPKPRFARENGRRFIRYRHYMVARDEELVFAGSGRGSTVAKPECPQGCKEVAGRLQACCRLV